MRIGIGPREKTSDDRSRKEKLKDWSIAGATLLVMLVSPVFLADFIYENTGFVKPAYTGMGNPMPFVPLLSIVIVGVCVWIATIILGGRKN